MADFSCSFLGLKLKSPIIIECNSMELDEISALANSGAGAIILKPIIEEELTNDSDHICVLNNNLESGNNISKLLTNSKSGTYLELIAQLKNKLDIPIIASIDCFSMGPWTDFTSLIEYVGADAIQLSIFTFPDDKDFRSSDYEKTYCGIATKVSYDVKIPVYIKITPYFTNLLNTIDQLFYRGIQGVAIFDSIGFHDINIQEFENTTIDESIELYNNNFLYKWIGIISSVIRELNIAAYCTSLNHENLIKYILSGAHAVIINQQHQARPDAIRELNNNLETWMNDNEFSIIDHFHGQMNHQEPSNLMASERELYLKSKGLMV